MTARTVLACAVVAALLGGTARPAKLLAQRGELALLGGFVQSPDEEFDRATSTTTGPPTYTRSRGSRESGAAAGLAATFAVRGHVFAELGVLSFGVERSISRTAVGDASGPFIATARYRGRVTTLWGGPAYRIVDRERLAVSALAAPVIHVMTGTAFDGQQLDANAPSRRAAIGALLGLRARYWLSGRLGAQLSVEDAIWTFPLTPHPSDGTPLFPDAYRRTPRQHDLRAHLGLTLRLF